MTDAMHPLAVKQWSLVGPAAIGWRSAPSEITAHDVGASRAREAQFGAGAARAGKGAVLQNDRRGAHQDPLCMAERGHSARCIQGK